MRFKLIIELGNDAMQTADELAEALRNAATRIETQYNELSSGQYGGVKDVNGNNVGEWEVE